VDDLEPSSPRRPRASSPEIAAAAGAREDDEEENEREYFEEHRSVCTASDIYIDIYLTSSLMHE
jgi:hypothetical protein